MLYRAPHKTAVDPESGEKYRDLLVIVVPDDAAKSALVEDPALPFFTVPHFNGYNAVLVQESRLGEIAHDEPGGDPRGGLGGPGAQETGQGVLRRPVRHDGGAPERPVRRRVAGRPLGPGRVLMPGTRARVARFAGRVHGAALSVVALRVPPGFGGSGPPGYWTGPAVVGLDVAPGSHGPVAQGFGQSAFAARGPVVSLDVLALVVVGTAAALCTGFAEVAFHVASAQVALLWGALRNGGVFGAAVVVRSVGGSTSQGRDTLPKTPAGEAGLLL
ncbi:hypothetical protein NG819_07690 [Pseudarthrobacter sp. Fe7]|nr:hypothetical protein NG819_07690 [Pseudarthrobacter sp. Fe7]